MTRTEMMSELLEVLNDASIDGMFTDTTLYGYLSEGQDKFCEDTGYFTDLSNFSLTLQSDVAVYPIPDRIVQILDIWDGTRKLCKVLTGEVVQVSQEGPPASWQTDQETGVIKLFPTPTSEEHGDKLVLQVWRHSLEDLAVAENDPEIPPRFHRACIEWASYKAFSHHDMETQDPVKAADHKAAYESYAREGKKALRKYQNQETRVGSDPAYRT